ncbi:alkaline phosphatase family protein [Thermodesulfobacteriota bacterium]
MVVGLDGANWDHLAPWLDAGELPNLKRLIERAAWSHSASEVPYVTFPNWKCYSTGKNPGKLGVFWWELVDVANRRVSMPNSRSFKSAELFDYLSDAGYRCGIINMPTTFPPRPLKNGFMIAGGPGCPDKGYSWPRDLEGMLKKRFDYRTHPRRAVDSGRKYIEEVLKLIDLRFETGKALLDRVDFLQITIFYINMLQHFFWREEPVLEGWKRIDKHLGDLMQLNCRLVLLSDHGCIRSDRIFNINAWLASEGYLVLQKKFASSRVPMAVKRLVSRLRRNPNLRNRVRRWLPLGLMNRVGLLQEELRGSLKFQMIDWDHTVAFASGQGPIYLNPESYRYRPGLAGELAHRLESLRDPSTDKPPILRVFHRDEVYKGDYLNQAPDLVAEQNEGYYINGRVGRTRLFESPDLWQAENCRFGIFLMYGPDISPGFKGETKITDIAPTMLHWHGLPVPWDMDGSVLKTFFQPHSHAASESVQYREAGQTATEHDTGDADEEIIRQQLINLGYMEEE